ncbi:MAG TPA: branched-chain amino acid ABC transporter permease [Deltaproteobacteria bacterium]|nr:branched-chain amino acid ABC transporter permease [Deltaproteobacteria bacterium]
MPAFAAAWPICLGYIAVGTAFGILAGQAGLALYQIALMSCIVFAGSAQFIAVSMISSGASIASIIITTFMVNLRHLLMSSSLSLHVQGENKLLLSLFSYGVTDESFAVNLGKFLGGGWNIKDALVLNQTANATWIASTIIGGYAGAFIPSGAFGIDYALTAMFLCLLVFQLRGIMIVLISAIAGTLSVALSLIVPGNLHVILSSIIAATIGVVVKSLYLRHKINRGDK